MTNKRSLFLLCMLLLGFTSPGLTQDDRGKGQPLFNLGVFAYEKGDYKTAEDFLKKALSSDCDDPFFNFYLGKVYLQTGEYSQAALFFDKARNTNEDLPDLAYHWAYINYLLNDFASAEKLFASLTVSEPDNALAHYYAGLASYKQKKYRQALRYLSQSARLDTPARYNADYYAGCCCLQLRDLKTAKQIFTRVEQNAEDEALKRSAAELLQQTQTLEDRQRRRYTLIAKVGWEFDDNEVLEPVDNNDLYADEDDHIISGYLSASYDFIRKGNFMMGAAYSHYSTLHDKLDAFDLSGSLFDLYARYRLNAYTFTLSYNPDYYWLDSESYLCRHEVRSVISREFENLATELTCYHQRDNNMYDSDQDGHADGFFFRCQHTSPGDSVIIRAGIGYEANSAELKIYDYHLVRTELAAMIDLGWGVYGTLCGECRFKKFDRSDASYGKNRDDTRYIGNILLSREIVDSTVSAHVGYEYTKNNSNIDDFNRYNADHEYESNAVKIFLTVKI